MWTLGIRDKRVISIISKMLKAEVEGEGISNKGTPQGGILSPLLSNIVLNELDWWVDSQWVGFNAKQITNHGRITDRPYKNTSNKLLALRRTNLKPCFIVRYADDFKIFTNTYENAQKIYNAVTNWLKERLNLEVSQDKSKIVNLKTHYSEFLGIELKANNKMKNGKPTWVIKSRMSVKEKARIIKEIKNKVFEVENDNTPKSMYKMNTLIMGVHNYYNCVTNINKDFNEIEHRVYSLIRFRWRRVAKNKGKLSDTFLKRYGKYKHRKKFFVRKIALYPISGINFKRPTIFNQITCNYTDEGRTRIHQMLEFKNKYMITHIMNNPVPCTSVEYNDNRISLFSAQQGRCAITGLELEFNTMQCHHKIPRSMNGTDEYKNLIILLKDIHLLIHSNKGTTQRRIIKKFNLGKEEIKKINDLRKLVGNYNITEVKLT